MTQSPIGSLCVEAEQKAKRKASREHTSTAPCGCSVQVHFFTANSSMVVFDPCADHIDKAKRSK